MKKILILCLFFYSFRPTKEFSLIISDSGFYPETIVVYEKEDVHLFVSSTLEKPSCFVLPEKDIFLSAYNNKVSETIFYFEYPGTYPFYCPNDNISGKIVVLSKNKVLNNRFLDKSDHWYPKDEEH